MERLTVADVAFEDSFVGDQDLGAAVGEDAADLGEGELRVQRDRDAAGADDGQEPVEAISIVAAVDGDGLARAQGDGTAKKCILGADIGMQFGEAVGAVFVD